MFYFITISHWTLAGGGVAYAGCIVAAVIFRTFGPTFLTLTEFDSGCLWFSKALHKAENQHFSSPSSQRSPGTAHNFTVCAQICGWWSNMSAAGEPSSLKGHLKRTTEINDCEREARPASTSSFPPPCVVSLEPRGLAVGPYWESLKGEIVTHQQSNKTGSCVGKKCQGVRF